MDAGCRFRGKYRVAALCDFQDASLRESHALKSKRVYSALTSKIVWPADIGPTTKWEFPLLKRYIEENGDVSTSGHRPAQRDGPSDSHAGTPVAGGSPPQEQTAPSPPRPVQSTAASSGSGQASSGSSAPVANAPPGGFTHLHLIPSCYRTIMYRHRSNRRCRLQ